MVRMLITVVLVMFFQGCSNDSEILNDRLNNQRNLLSQKERLLSQKQTELEVEKEQSSSVVSMVWDSEKVDVIQAEILNLKKAIVSHNNNIANLQAGFDPDRKSWRNSIISAFTTAAMIVFGLAIFTQTFNTGLIFFGVPFLTIILTFFIRYLF